VLARMAASRFRLAARSARCHVRDQASAVRDAPAPSAKARSGWEVAAAGLRSAP
jgi:hypothetical protein